MKILEEFPPNYEKIKARFDLTGKAPLFCYGDTVYNPYKVVIRPDLEIHEEVHVRQQGDDPDGWWEKYLDDNEFRLSQELEAYATQYGFIKSQVKTKTASKFLDLFAEILASPMYGSVVSFQQARSKIRNKYLTLKSMV